MPGKRLHRFPGWRVSSTIRSYLLYPDQGPVAGDLRPSVSRSQEWTYIVETNPEVEGDVVVAWPELGRSLPENLALTLEDLTTGRRQSLRTTRHYTYRVTRGETARRFRITAQPRQGNGIQITNLAVQPTRGGWNLSFGLTQPGFTDIQVRTISGRTVAAVETQQSRNVGLQQIAWAPRDDQGRPLPNGVYLVQITAVDEEGNRTQAVRTVEVR